jgi:3-isopropylmalate dehydrogenase
VGEKRLVNKSILISCIEGDGIGPELLQAARIVLKSLVESFDLKLDFVNVAAGDRELRKTGRALPNESFKLIQESDVCLKAPVGESAKETIVRIRQELDLYANVRPARNYPFIPSKFSNVDLVIVRENTEDLYVGFERRAQNGRKATALKVVTSKASERIAKFAFELAMVRKQAREKPRSVVCITKSNVLKITDGLFVKSCEHVSRKYPQVLFQKMYVDTAAMNLIRAPESFDVIVTTNMYGDILSDEASQLVGGLGVSPSANIGRKFALFEPVHGCAPDIAGKGIANPLAMILSVEMMLDWLSETRLCKRCHEAAQTLDKAICSIGASGIKTPDIGGRATTLQVAEAISKEIKLLASSSSFSDDRVKMTKLVNPIASST